MASNRLAVVVIMVVVAIIVVPDLAMKLSYQPWYHSLTFSVVSKDDQNACSR
jgi:hypothetical protein